MFFKINETLFLLKTTTKLRQNYTKQLIRCFSDKKQESYFGAIGGESKPPPDLTANQVNTILKTHEMKITKSIANIRFIECNQLASNHPIEDRLRITRFHFNSNHNHSSDSLSGSLASAVFDGHGGGSCADLVSRRLFLYIALSLIPDLKTYDRDQLKHVIEDLFCCPNPYHNITSLYEDRTAEYLRKYLLETEHKNLENFVKDLKPTDDISSALENAFLRCDSDLSEEIEYNLLNSTSNVIIHYYLSLAVSGCVVSLLLMHNNIAYIASTGDCRAILGLKNTKAAEPVLKAVELSKEHNSDNISELKRLFSEHPKSEQNNIVKNERLLGQLMPLRSFGDYSFKWSVDKMKRLGLTKAFGSHVIPANYLTPPYLTCKPEISVLPLADIEEYDCKAIVLATDGLWDHFEASRNVIKCVHKFKERLRRQERQEDKDSQHKIIFEMDTTLGQINDKLKPSAKPASTSFPEVTRDDDLIEDKNCATHLIRTALGADASDHQIDQFQQQQRQHTRLVSYLTLPQSVVRNFRDDISLIVVDISHSSSTY